MIETENLTKRFVRSNGSEILAVDQLSLSVEPGQIFGFLGPNGVGKTTTIRMLTGLLAPTAGTARINGFEIGCDDQSIRQTVGLLSENPGFYDTLSAERNLTFFARLYGLKHPAEQTLRYLKWLGLLDRSEDAVGTFSKGMRQKLGLARAAMHSPEVLFLDEPTSGLDPDVARQMRDFMVALKDDGKTIFLCTHNLDEADRLCDRVGIFKHRLIAVDTPRNLRAELFGKEIIFSLGQMKSEWLHEIRQFPFVSQAHATEFQLFVRLESPAEQNPVIVRKLVELGADIHFVSEKEHTLEDVYLRLIER